MQIEYCESCHKRVTDHDFDVGVAAWHDEQVYCKDCLQKKGYTIQFPAPSAKRTSSGRLITISGSKIRKVPSGSAIRKIAPDSGVHNASQGSGVRKASSGSALRKVSTPGSGIHKYSNQGSGVRKVSRASSGIQTIPRSGILVANRSAASKSSGKLARSKPRWYKRHAQEGNGAILFTLLAGAAALLLAAGLYFLIIK